MDTEDRAELAYHHVAEGYARALAELTPDDAEYLSFLAAYRAACRLARVSPLQAV